MKVAMIVAQEKFRDEELLEPERVLESEGFGVEIFSRQSGKARGMLGAVVDADSYENLNEKDYDAVVLVGGTGASVYFNDKRAHEIAIEMSSSGKVVAAICIAPSTLANAGLLKGKRATCFRSEAANLKQKGATYTGNDVETDGSIVTADGPKAAEKFGREIANLLRKS